MKDVEVVSKPPEDLERQKATALIDATKRAEKAEAEAAKERDARRVKEVELYTAQRIYERCIRIVAGAAVATGGTE